MPLRAFLLLLTLPAIALAQRVEQLPVPAGANATTPFLAVSRGDLLLSWLEPLPATDRVALRFARYHAGAWSAPRTIVERNDLLVNWADFPSIAADAKGVLFAQWLQKRGNESYDAWMSLSTDGGVSWRRPLLLNRDGSEGEHGFASLAPLPNGGVAAAWLENGSLRVASVDARGTLAGATALDARTCECCATGMAVATSGPVVVYRDRSADEIRDIAVVRNTAGGWTKPKVIHADGWKIAGCPVNGPQADAAGDRLAVAWFTAVNEQPRAFVAFSDDAGATFAAPIRVDDGKPLGRVDVALLDRNTAAVTWVEQTAGGAEIRARRVQRDGTAKASVKIADASASRGGGVPRAAAIGETLYVTWMSGKQVHVCMLRP